MQYSSGEGGVWAEVAGNEFRPEHRRLSKADQQALGTAGWRKPERGNRGVPNWWVATGEDDPSPAIRLFRRVFEHGRPAPSYRQLADMTVMALRDVMRIGIPLGLRYRAFVQASGEPVVLDDLGLQPE